jgi:Mrp family chromosome partitioning ATPase
MADSIPGLIQRAAARLERASAGSASLVERAPARQASSTIASPLAVKKEAVLSGPGSRQRIVALSPTSLAANGIALPGAGFSRTVDEFRAVKRHVLANAMRARGTSSPAASRVVLVTSAKPGDGKTFTAINLAFALAYEKDTRVLLLDADAYRQSLLEYLGISADGGWIDLVSAASVVPGDTVLHTNVPNLEILAAGKQRPEIPELMSSRHMKKLLDELVREDPDRYIIIDSLPCLTSTEPSILAALAGQTLFVVAAHQTRRDEIDSSLRVLNASPSVNLVLNRAESVLTEQFKEQAYGS